MMSKKFIPVILFLTGASVFLAFQSQGKNENDNPKTRYSKILRNVGILLEEGHFSPKKIDDSFSKQVFKKWNFAVNSNGRLARIRNSLQTSWFNTPAGNANANITYKATPVFTIASNSGYFVPLRTPNNTFPENYFYGFNFIFKLFKTKLNLTATATNFFEKERKLNFLTENANFKTESVSMIPFRNFGLSMSYNFGKLKENVSKKKGVNNDDQVQ